jgi:hypothetical protein
MGRKRKIMNSDLSLKLEELSDDLSEDLEEDLSEDLEIGFSDKEIYIQSYEDLNIPYCKKCGEIFIKDAFNSKSICSLNLTDCSRFKE